MHFDSGKIVDFIAFKRCTYTFQLSKFNSNPFPRFVMHFVIVSNLNWIPFRMQCQFGMCQSLVIGFRSILSTWKWFFYAKYPLGQNNVIDLSTTMTICIWLTECEAVCVITGDWPMGLFTWIYNTRSCNWLTAIPLKKETKEVLLGRKREQHTWNYLLVVGWPFGTGAHILSLTFSLLLMTNWNEEGNFKRRNSFEDLKTEKKNSGRYKGIHICMWQLTT